MKPARHCIAIGFIVTTLALLSGQSCLGPSTPTPTPSPGGTPTPRVTACGLIGNSCEVTAGNSPDWITIADLDADGDNDIAVANFGGDSISVFLNDGSGKYTLGSTLAAGDSPSSVVAADFDLDGKVDLVVSSAASVAGPGVSFFKNTGQAKFAAPFSYPTGDVAGMLAVGDLDRNGSLDLATANPFSNSLSLLAGGANGAFSAPIKVTTGSRPRFVALTDVDGDGSLDLAVVNELDGVVSVHRNNGQASFLLPMGYLVGSHPYSIVAADFNADGSPDLAVANEGSLFDSGDTVSLLLNNGNGTFRSGGNFVIGANPVFIVVGDFNGDHRPDIATANLGTGLDDSGVAILLNNGGGTFATPTLFAAGDGPTALAVGDLDRDGDLDIAVADYTGNRVVLLGNDGKGSFSRAE